MSQVSRFFEITQLFSAAYFAKASKAKKATRDRSSILPYAATSSGLTTPSPFAPVATCRSISVVVMSS